MVRVLEIGLIIKSFKNEKEQGKTSRERQNNMPTAIRFEPMGEPFITFWQL